MRPRLLLVSEFTELEWGIKPRLEEWAEVISYDPPGVGAEPLPVGVADASDVTREVVTTRGLEKLDAAGWERFFLVADGWGIANAVGIATRCRGTVAGMALGHAALSFSREGERPAINAEVYNAFTQLVRNDARSFLRHGIAQVTGGGFDEDLAERIMERIPPEYTVRSWLTFTADEPFRDRLLELTCPLLLAKHKGCLLNTDEGFEDAVAALPSADTALVDDAPSVSPDFAEALRRFCETRWA